LLSLFHYFCKEPHSYWAGVSKSTRGGFALVTGAPGTGKSVTLRILAERLGAQRDIKIGIVSRPQAGLADFYREMGDLFDAVRQAVLAQYAAHKGWSAKLHHDNLVALAETKPDLKPVPSYPTLRVMRRRLSSPLAFMNRRRTLAQAGRASAPHEETAKHRDLPKLLGQELQAHFKPLQDVPHRMFTLLMQLKNIRAPRGERSAPPCSSKKAPPTRKGSTGGSRLAFRHCERSLGSDLQTRLKRAEGYSPWQRAPHRRVHS
jgi:hypothetical protein